MTWLIVGGNGQLGRAISFVLGERKIPFLAWGSNELNIKSSTFTLSLVGELKPVVIINTAAWTDVDGAEINVEEAHAVNSKGALNLALSAKSVGAIFAHISTDYVFSGSGTRPWGEHDLHSPLSVYGKTKAAGEVAVLSNYSESSYIFRTSWLYSKWGKNFAKTMTRLALSNQDEVRVVDDQFGQPTSALDLADQIIDSIIAKIPFGIYHATNSGEASWCDFAREVFDLCVASSERVVATDSSSFERPARRPAYSVLGHEAWKAPGKSGISVGPMRDWRIALKESMPSIITTIRTEG